MADQVQNIIIKYEADITELQKGLAELQVQVAGTQELVVDNAKEIDKGFEKTEKSVSTLGKSLGKLSTLVVGAFAAKAVFEFSRAVVQASLRSDELAPKVKELSKNYNALLETIGSSAGVTAVMDALITTTNNLVTSFDAILKTDTLTFFDKLATAMTLLSGSARIFNLVGKKVSEGTAAMRDSFSDLTKELKELNTKALNEYHKTGQISIETQREITNKTLQVKDAQAALIKVTENLTKDQDKQTKSTKKQLTQFQLLGAEITRLTIIAQDEVFEFGRVTGDTRKLLTEAQEAQIEVQKQLIDGSGEYIELKKIEIEVETEAAEVTLANSTKITESAVKRSKTLKEQLEDIENLRTANFALQSAFTSLFEIGGEQGESGAKFQKKLAVFTLAIDTALAISGAIRSAQVLPFPANLAAIAVGVATVLANLATANKALESAGAPPTFGEGGWINGLPHTYGGTPILGEKDEFVIKAVEAKKNAKLIEAINKGYGEKYIIDSYLPKLKEYEEFGDKSFANNIVNSIAMSSYNDRRLRDAVMLGYRKGDKNTSRIVQAIKSNNSSNHRGW